MTSIRGHRILVSEPDPWRRESLVRFLEREGAVLTTHPPGPAPAEPPGATPVELVLLNLAGRRQHVRREQVEETKAAWPGARIVAFLAELDSAQVFPCLLLGVKGFLPYDAPAPQVQAAIEGVLGGTLWAPRAMLAEWVERIASLGIAAGTEEGLLSKAERRVLEGVVQELSNKEIARKISVSEATVKFHVGRLLRKTGARDRRDLARLGRESLL